jgi:hypothetical protein
MGDGVANDPHRTAPHRIDDDDDRTHPPSVGMISRPVEAKGGRSSTSFRGGRGDWPRSGKTQAFRGPRPRHAREVVVPDPESGRWMRMRRPPFAARSCTSSSWGGMTPSPLPVASSFLVHGDTRHHHCRNYCRLPLLLPIPTRIRIPRRRRCRSGSGCARVGNARPSRYILGGRKRHYCLESAHPPLRKDQGRIVIAPSEPPPSSPIARSCWPSPSPSSSSSSSSFAVVVVVRNPVQPPLSTALA